MKYPHLAARIFNTPLLIHPQKLDALIAGLGGRLLGASPAQIHVVGAGADALLAPELFSTRRGERAERGYRIVDGVAVLSASGALVHRTRMEADSTWLVGYNDLAADLEDAMANPEVHAVLQVYDTPGGESQGAFEYAQRIFDMRGRKTMWAIADGMAASAGYLAASAADQFMVTSTGYAGSIGVVARHVDFSRAIEADGITITQIFAGAHKVDGNPFEPLPESVRKEWQADINGLYAMFVDAVAKHTGLDAAAVRATEAATYSGQAAVAAGLASRVSTTDQLIAELGALRVRSYPSGPAARTPAEKGASMSGTNPGGTQAAAPQTITQADLDAARADGIAQGAKAERERTASILGHESAKGRADLAMQCVSMGLTVEQSVAILGATPAAPSAAMVAPGAAQGAQFAAAMNALGNPDVTGREGGEGGGSDESALAAQVLDSFRLTSA